ncbi:MAG: hypothetical protein KIT22_05810 [Verrucomicrobiae bacterium]|nr:hypothetical protein [Verrucomicrobiae bacterium]
MKPSDSELDDSALRQLLREAHPAPVLPSQFSEKVWRRLGRGSAKSDSVSLPGWIELLMQVLFRPAVAGIAAFIAVAGIASGVFHGESRVRKGEESRYLISVSPFHRQAP